MKKHGIVEKNYYYLCADHHRKWDGWIKPGISQQEKVNARYNCIHCDEPNMTLMGYLTIYNTTKSRLEAIEHEIKAHLVDAGFEHYGNDHFKFKFDRKGSRKTQYQNVATAIFALAMAYCKKYNLRYEWTEIG